MNWYYYDGQKPVGPLSTEAMQQLRNCGMLNAETPVAPEGASGWQTFEIAMADLPKIQPPKGHGRNAMAKLAAGVGAAAGLESAESSGGFQSIFKDAFRKRTIEEMEAQFAVGTPETTPALGAVKTHWPAPWVFFRLITFSVLATLGFYWGAVRFRSDILLLGWILVGAFGIPFSVLIFFMEANVLRNVSFYRILKLFMLGGLMSMIFTMVFNELTGLESWLGVSSAGPIEEPAKILAVVAFASRWKDKHWTLNGMLFGAAVGAGFAAFETAGYVLVRSQQFGSTFGDVMFTRALLAPFMHVIWTAAAGAALWRVRGNRAFSFELLLNWQFLRVLLMVTVIHAVWNSPLVVPFVGDPWNGILKCVGLGVIGWVLILLLIQNGLAQIRNDQDVMKPNADLEPSQSLPSDSPEFIEATKDPDDMVGQEPT